MQISLFTYTGERNRVNKNEFITNRFAMNGNLKNNSSVIDPVILIEKTNPAIQNYNYMYIEEFGRWYFINDIISINTGLWEIHAHVDVLYTWYTDIASSECVIEKYEQFNDANLYYDDGSFITDCRKTLELKEFPNGFNENGEFILICAGGV